MKWQGRRTSSNVNRSSGKRVAGGISAGGIVLILIISLITGNNPLDMLGNTALNNPPANYEETRELSETDKQREEFLSVVLADTEDVWNEIFDEHSMDYREPSLMLYTGAVDTGCGLGQAKMGPFYCPADETVYIDTDFTDELSQKFGARGDFAMAYVLAHEVGHHVQNQLGITDEVFGLRSKLSEEEFNKYSVKMELQADYFAGVYAKFANEKGYLEAGDIEEAMNAAAAVGDDTIQKKAFGKVLPETFTHGSSKDRKNWFTKGFEYGTIEDGNTFE